MKRKGCHWRTLALGVKTRMHQRGPRAVNSLVVGDDAHVRQFPPTSSPDCFFFSPIAISLYSSTLTFAAITHAISPSPLHHSLAHRLNFLLLVILAAAVNQMKWYYIYGTANPCQVEWQDLKHCLKYKLEKPAVAAVGHVHKNRGYLLRMSKIGNSSHTATNRASERERARERERERQRARERERASERERERASE